MKPKGTYVYCLVAASRQPSLARVPRGLPGTGVVRLLEHAFGPEPRDLRAWLVAADAPLERFGAEVINERLQDLDWIARAAVAHEGVVESFVAATALLPMKLFTIFTSDARALAHISQQRDHVRTVLKRVTRHDEWGVRVAFDRARAIAPRPGRPQSPRKPISGAGYLAGKKATREARVRLASRARDVIADLNELLGHHASLARRRGARDLPVKDGPLLLDAAYLVDRSHARRFRTTLAREARRLAPEGYRVSLTGPWPPYSFLE